MKRICFRLLLNLALVVSIACALALPTAAMADLITLQIPGIPGDLTGVPGETNPIEVLAVSSAIQNPAPGTGGGGGGGAGKAVFSDLIINKRFDSSSPALFLKLVTGTLLENAVITFLQDKRGLGLTKVFTITLTNVLVTNFETAASENKRRAGESQEQVNLHYRKIQLKDEVTGQQACFDFFEFRVC